ncbi:DUF3800 domain-containing protein [Mammaliicoccus sp. C-M14]|uniref:DUF3800 domain-containing protein n=1 Tax=Mammaliicoccus sp. C-M14 TaxID=2898674 RepID=UPI001EFB18EA|nr:DUF3800 domain-containing protein [Mammaliicoccus sp. C-M14]
MKKSFYGDESGSITRSNAFINRYFVIGFISPKNTNDIVKINRDFRKLKVKFIQKNNLNLDFKKEIKGSQMPLPMKEFILEKLCKKYELTIHYAIIDNFELYEKLRKEPHIAFNYLINTYFKDNHRNGINHLKLKLDDRNKAIINLNDLEHYLQTELFVHTDVEKVYVTYHESHNVPLIQLSDIFCNLMFKYVTYYMNATKDHTLRKKSDYLSTFNKLNPYIECYTSFPQYRSSFICPHR